jgi:hypothetical protein
VAGSRFLQSVEQRWAMELIFFIADLLNEPPLCLPTPKETNGPAGG